MTSIFREELISGQHSEFGNCRISHSYF